jgi:hypothetical protein
MNNKVIYTACFGGDNYYLHDPEVVSDGYDYICFTDNANFKSDIWDVRMITPTYDPVRNSKKPKLVPHRYLSEYDISIWVDTDIKIIADPNELVDRYLNDVNLAVLNHEYCSGINSRNCVYKEAEFIQWLGDQSGNYKDNMEVVHAQVQRYRDAGYPANNGQGRTTIIIRRHNEKDVKLSSEKWWEELKNGSRRDQLSFNYSHWVSGIKFEYMNEDIDNNKWFKLMKRWRQIKRKENMKQPKYQPISLDYFLKMELARGGGGKEIITQGEKLKTVGDVVEFWTGEYGVGNMLTPGIWQYYNAMRAEFRKGVGDHHKLGWENMSEEYYSSLEEMTDDEIGQFLKDNPVEFENGFIKHSYHRACAMIGRLSRGKPYIPFYMDENKIYNPREKDGILRIKSPIYNIDGIGSPEAIGIPKEHFTICQSGILALMGIRKNDDIDIIISNEIRAQLFGDTSGEIRQNGIEIFAKNRLKFKLFDAQGDTDLIENYSLVVNGYRFLEPRFYFSRKHRDKTERDINDWKMIRLFFEQNTHKTYPFNQLSEEQWGIQYI